MDYSNVLNAREYIAKECESVYPESVNQIKVNSEENIKWIEENATLMTVEELTKFLEYDYGYIHPSLEVENQNHIGLITSYVTREDIDLIDKLENMVDSEISQEIKDKCDEEETFKKIEEKVWELMNDNSSKFSKKDFYDGLADGYEAVDYKDMLSACVYNCDFLYMTAIACVLDLEIPKSVADTHIFGITYGAEKDMPLETKIKSAKDNIKKTSKDKTISNKNEVLR